jgi:hypothetical protein
MALIKYLTDIQIDAGARALLPAECERTGIAKPLIVTDAGVRAAGVLQQVLDALPPAMRGAVYDGTPAFRPARAPRARAAECTPSRPRIRQRTASRVRRGRAAARPVAPRTGDSHDLQNS